MQIKDKQISYNLRKPFDLIDSLNEKTPPKIGGVAIGDPNGTRLDEFLLLYFFYRKIHLRSLGCDFFAVVAIASLAQKQPSPEQIKTTF